MIHLIPGRALVACPLLALLLALLLAQTVTARESWPVPDAAINARDTAWSNYEQQVIANVTPQLAEWQTKGKPYLP